MELSEEEDFEEGSSRSTSSSRTSVISRFSNRPKKSSSRGAHGMQQRNLSSGYRLSGRRRTNEDSMDIKAIQAKRRWRACTESNRVKRFEFKSPRKLPEAAWRLENALTSRDEDKIERAIINLVMVLCRGLGVRMPPKVIGKGMTQDGYAGELVMKQYPVTTGLPPKSCKLIVRPIRTNGKYHDIRRLTRLVVHEVCHHADLTVLKLWETYHTRGFYSRVDSLLEDVLKAARQIRPPKARAA